MNDETRKQIEALAKEILVKLDEVQLDLLRAHIGIHRVLLRQVAQKKGCGVQELGRMSFSKAAKKVYGAPKFRDIYAALKMLNRARNSLAHEEVPAEMFVELGNLGRHIFGPTYKESPESFSEMRAQVRKTLEFIHAWVANP